jgi:ABC-type uncharacterized transport system permease subunit
MTAIMADAAGNPVSERFLIAVVIAGGLALVGVATVIVIVHRNSEATTIAVVLFGAFVASLVAFAMVRLDSRDAIAGIASILAAAIANMALRAMKRPDDPEPDDLPEPHQEKKL